MPKVSVIMSTYNDARFLKFAVDSILRQTYADFEFIIVNDASTDTTEDILQAYQEEDKRIRVFSNETNQERSFSRNLAIKNSSGKYIAILDSDDVCSPTRLKTQVEYLDQNQDIGVLGSAKIKINNRGRITGKPIIYPEAHNQIVWRILSSCPMVHPSVMLRASVIADMDPYNLKCPPCEDQDLWFRLLLTGHKFENLRQPLVYFRESPEQKARLRSSHELSRSIKRKYISQLAEVEEGNKDLTEFLSSSPIDDLEELFSIFNFVNSLETRLLEESILRPPTSDCRDEHFRLMIKILGRYAHFDQIALHQLTKNVSSDDMHRFYWLNRRWLKIIRWPGYLISKMISRANTE